MNLNYILKEKQFRTCISTQRAVLFALNICILGGIFYPTKVEAGYLVMYEFTVYYSFIESKWVSPLVPNPGSGSTPVLWSVFLFLFLSNRIS